MSDREVRNVSVAGLEVRADEGESPRIVGHAAVFDRDSDPIGGMFIERIAPGAFKRALGEGQDVRALINHDANFVLGRSKAGTLRMAEDKVGLAIEIDPPDTQAARDLMTSIGRGDIDQMSFAFTVAKGGQRWDEGGEGELDVRTLTDLDLYDVSVVTYPAYPDTDAGVRAHAEWRSAQSEPETVKPEPVVEDEPAGTPKLNLKKRRQALED